jgi:CheY-like chemotaxis protein
MVAAEGTFLSKAGFEGRIGHLLVVEDSALLAMDVELTAVDLGVERASAAPDASKALALIETESFDAALVDLFLGNDDGRMVAGRLAELGIPFALMTGSGDVDWLQAQMPGTPVLTKPFTREELAETLDKLCY